MQITISLRNPFSYSHALYVFALLIVAFAAIKLIKKLKKKYIPEKEKKKKIKQKKNNKNSTDEIKRKYLKEINVLIKEANSENEREEYQKLSKLIRLFVFEVTGIEVQNYSLSEIEKLNMPSLYELVEEYYEPEFSKYQGYDIKSSLEKTRKVIKEWK